MILKRDEDGKKERAGQERGELKGGERGVQRGWMEGNREMERGRRGEGIEVDREVKGKRGEIENGYGGEG